MTNSKTSIGKRIMAFSLAFFLAVFIGGGVAFFLVINVNVHSTAEQGLLSLAKLERTSISGEVNKQIALASQMSNSAVIQAYLRAPNDETLKEQAYREFQSYAKSFNSQNIFWASNAFNDNGEHDYYFGFEFAYSLLENAPNEQWYVNTKNNAAPYMFNIDSNPKSGTRLWINAKAMDGGEFLGIVGIGVELTEFFDTVYKNVDADQYDLYFFNADGEITGAEDAAIAEAKAPLAEHLSAGQKCIDALKTLPVGEATVIRDGSHEIGLINVEIIGWAMAIDEEITPALYLTNSITILYLIVIIAVAVVIVIFNIFVIKGIVSPIYPIVAQAKELSNGNVNIEIKRTRTDELGELQESLIHLLKTMRSESLIIEQIASGDLSLSYTPVSEQDVVGNSLIKLLEYNNQAFKSIRIASEEVRAGAQQI